MDKLGVNSHHISPSNTSHRHTNTQPPTESVHTKTKKLIKYLNQTWCVGEGWYKLSMFVASLASSHRQKDTVWFYWSQWAVICFHTSAHWWTIDVHRVDPPTLHVVSWKRRMKINLLYGCETLFTTLNSVFQKVCLLQEHQVEQELHSVLLLLFLIN